PRSLEEATAAAQTLIDQGIDFDAGLGQINVRNWAWLKLDATTVFDPCRNLAAAQTVLADCYARALPTHKDPQQALRAALSCYNTGNFRRGFTNGYVGKVPVIVKLLVACEYIQAARLRLFSAEAISTGFLSGFRCTTSIRDQFRRGPAQRWGARARAAS